MKVATVQFEEAAVVNAFSSSRFKAEFMAITVAQAVAAFQHMMVSDLRE